MARFRDRKSAHFFIAKDTHCGILVVESDTKWWKVGIAGMFMGEYRHSLDSKNRLIIPSRFREELGGTFVVTRYLEGCLTIYTNEQWKKITEKLSAIPMTNKAGRQFSRIFLSKAVECEPDGQGRIQLPATLIQSAEIIKKCVVIGTGDHIEIWAEERWDEYNRMSEESFEDAAETLTEFLI
jgi:MraZ protein